MIPFPWTFPANIYTYKMIDNYPQSRPLPIVRVKAPLIGVKQPLVSINIPPFIGVP